MSSDRAPEGPRAVRLVGLDGLRGLAAVAVLANHTAEHASGVDAGPLRILLELGAQGLTVFFVLSGFLLYRPFAAAVLDGAPLPATGRYLRNRALRILPAYWVVLLLAGFVLGLAYLHGDTMYFTRPGDVGRLTDPLTAAANLLLVQTFLPATMLTGIATAWSLTTEVSFYLVLPLLAAGAAALARRALAPRIAALAPAVLLLATGAVFVLALTATKAHLDQTASWYASWGPTGSAVLERSLLTQAALFGLGMLVAWAVEVRRRSGRFFLAPLMRGLLLSLALAVAARGVLEDLVGNNVLGVAAAVVLYTVVLPTSAGRASLLTRLLDTRALRGLGEISYSVYLWHLPVITWLVVSGWARPGPLGLVANVGVVLPVTLALATATYLLVERPALRLKGRARTSGRAPAGGAVVPAGAVDPRDVVATGTPA
ncbi:acyltransferase [Amnibacterium sp. CER49]|uniref:acyltransferase family protein n=1 Tax=Amnibacterium sp. CER49 TaxID=3039161 RepID=UPI002449F0B2|nr:acyltransferase [Amnibacterium sp. CER49]MDH2444383.1 acyltransferase [Amnibacterium sp. CER49]